MPVVPIKPSLLESWLCSVFAELTQELEAAQEEARPIRQPLYGRATSGSPKRRRLAPPPVLHAQ